MEKVERVQELLENMFCKERLGELDLFSLVKRWPRSNLTAACSYLKGSDKVNRTHLLAKLRKVMTRGNSHVLQHGEFQLDITKNPFY